MAYTTIDNPELYFQTKLYTGTGSELAVTLDGDENMQPDLVWSKNRDQAEGHKIFDSVRTATKYIMSNNTDAEATGAETLKSFDSDGVTIGTDADMNTSSEKNVLWCWKAGTSFTNDASATSVGNTDSSGSASSTAGFSIAKWVGAGASLDIQVKHGLSAKPAVMFTKNIEEAGGNHWAVYHHKNTSAPETDYLKLSDTTATTDDADIWNDTEPTSAIFTAGDHSGSNRSGDDFVGYFWNEVQGYSKFGGWTGNGNADGPYIHLGFRPAWIMYKTVDQADNWEIHNNKTDTFNPMDTILYANRTNAESDPASTTDRLDFLSNGFKIRTGSSDYNGDGNTYIYMAFAEAPFVNSNGVPCNAR